MTADEIRAALTTRAPDVCSHLFPAGRRVGDEYEIGSLGGEQGRSLRINLNGKLGVWSDFATGDKGDNLLELWRRVRGHDDIRPTMAEAAEWLGSPARRPDCTDSNDIPAGHPKWRSRPAGRWIYRDADGKPWLATYRYDTNDGKAFFTYDCRARKWIEKGGHRPPDRRPLYRLDTFAHRPAGEIVLVEGEKCADALSALGLLSTSTLGGAGQVRQADFTPLRGWTVRIWQDADDAGRKYAETAAAMLRDVGAEPMLVPVPTGKADGWDVADAIAEGWNAEEVRAQLEMAEPAIRRDDGTIDEPARSRFTFLADDELEQLTPPDWLIDGIIPAQGLVQLVGAPGSMKSFLALDFCAHVRLGLPWAGRPVLSVPPLYVLAEGARGFGLRLRAWRIHHNHSTRLGIQFLTVPVQLADTGDVTELLRAIDGLAERPRLVVIDTQARCAVGLEENSNTDMGRLIAGAERLQRELAGVVTLLHHTPRDGDRERGASAQRGGVDTTLVVLLDGEHLTVRVDRQKDGESGATLNFRRRIIEVDDKGQTSCVLIPVLSEGNQTPTAVGDVPQSVRTLLNALRASPDAMSATELLKHTQMRERTFYDALKRANAWGLIEQRGKAYGITAKARELLK